MANEIGRDLGAIKRNSTNVIELNSSFNGYALL
jgi:hypothetical protein